MVHEQKSPGFSNTSTSKEKKLFRNRSNLRRLMVESLEDRRLLNVDWRNPVDSIDVDNDGSISPLDALVVINYINASGSGTLPAVHDLSKPYLDVDGDQSVSPLDVLNVINHLNAKGSGARSLNEVAGQLINETNVTITLGQTSGTRDYRVRIDNQFDTTDQSAALEDLLAVYLVDPLQPTTTLLDRGTNGTALFTLAGTKAEFVPGRVSWDGSVLDINLSDLASSGTGLLKFQLLNSDSDGQTKVTIVPLTNQIDIEGTNGPKLSLDGSPVAAGPSTTLANLTPMANGQLQVGNVRYDSSTGKYNAEIRLRNDGDSIGRDVAVVFPGLPAGVSLRSPSGTTTAGEPYINLKTAIQRGGLTHGSWSEPVAIEFNNPGQVLFVLKPKILAATNHSPTLAAIAPLTVMPGGVLKVSPVAADQDGDPITFSLVTTGGTVSLPTGTLGSSGVLTFRPTPSQLGAYQFNVIASDGALEVIQPVTLNVVADPLTTTRVSGRVLQVNGAPLVGMRVEIGSVQGLTISDGTFTLDLGSGPVISDTIKIRGDLLAGSVVYPFISEKLSLVLEHEVLVRVNNVIDRPIYLPELDIANAKQIDPTKDTTVTTAAIPGVAVMVAAGTLMNQQGTVFTGKLSVTEVPANLTPAALPNGQRPDLVVTIQPGEMVFAKPAPLTLPNRGGYPPLTRMTLWSINPVSGAFDIAGTGLVSADGSVINTISGGIRNSSWHDFSVATLDVDLSDGRNEDNGCQSCRYTSGLTSEVQMDSGAVIEQHPLVTYKSNGLTNGLTLTYDSLRADPRPIIHFGVSSVPDVPAGCVEDGGRSGGPCRAGVTIPAPDDQERFAATLSVQNGTFVYQVPGYTGNLPGLTGGENFWTYNQTDRVDAALQADLRSFPSGIYSYTVNAGFLRRDANGFTGSLSTPSQSQIISVNSIDSPFGAGWGIAGLQNIMVANTGTALLIDGGGSQLRFLSSGGGAYLSPPGDFTKLERVGGLFRRTTPDQTVYQFNADNQLATITDRNSNVTTYQYSAGKLVGIQDSVELTTTFAYRGARVSTITDPAGRITALEYDIRGNLTSVTDPDGARRTYGYDADHHKVSETDPLGRQDQTSYGFHGRAVGGMRYDASHIQIDALQTQGLLSPQRTSDPLAASLAVRLRNTNVSYVDSNGNVSITQLDRFGQAVNQTDRLGALPVVNRDVNNLPTSMIDARGNGTLQTYDARGNLLSQRDSLSSGSEVFGAILPASELDHYSFAGHTGQRLFFDVPETTNANFQITVRDSYGQYVGGFSTNALVVGIYGLYAAMLVLPRDDTYSVTVGITPDRDYPATTGAYRFRLIDLDSVPALRFGSPISGSGVDSQIFTFHATAGQTLTLKDLSGGASPRAQWYLVDEQNGKVGDVNNFRAGNISFFVPGTGNYTLLMRRSYDGSVQKYKFQAALVDAPAVPTVGLDTDYTGTLASNAAPLTFPFTAPAGTAIYVNQFGSGPLIGIGIKDSTTGQYVGGSGQIFVVPRSGNYTATVAGSGQFAFRLIDVSAAPLEPLGTIVSGTLNEADRVMAYRFQGQTGQQIDFGNQYYINDFGNRIYIKKELQYQNAYVTISDYFGRVVTLARTGEYTVLVSSNGTPPTSFTLPLIDVSTATHVSLNAPITGQLVAGSGPRYLQFTAQKGDTLYLDDLGSSTKVRVRLHELSFNGNPELSFGYSQQTGIQHAGATVDIPVTGTYLIVLDADDADRPANYNFRLLTAKTNVIPLTLGQVVQASFTEPLQTNVYTFQGTAGQQLYLDWLGPYSPDVARTLLREPNGNALQSDSYSETLQDFYSQRLIVLRQSGTYRLEFGNTTSRQLGTTSFRLSDVSAATSLTFRTPQAGSLVPYETKLYKLHATAGQRITIMQTAGDGDLDPALYLPNGEASIVLNNSTFAVPVTIPVTFSGDYTLAVKKGPNSATPGSYEFQIGDVSDSAVTPAGIDHVYTGTGDSTEQTLGTFTANAGTLIFFNGRLGTGYVKFVEPAGNVVLPPGFYDRSASLPSSGSTSDSFITLPVSGTYTVKVTASAAFSFRVRPAADAPLIALDTNVVGSTDTANAGELYRLNVAPGQLLQFDRTDSNQQTIKSQAYMSSGTSSFLLTYSNLTVAGAVPKPLPLPGTYYGGD